MAASAPQYTYSAAFDPTEQTVTLIRDAHAAVSGPAGEWPATNLEQAAAALFAAGYLTADRWARGGYGDVLWCREVTPMTGTASWTRT